MGVAARTSLLEDFGAFKQEPSVNAKIELTAKICNQYNQKLFCGAEAEIVNEILNFLSNDIEKKVRKTLSQMIKSNPDIPHDVAMNLASDVEEVSVPILEFSSVLTDDDLMAIIKSSEEIGKLTAIAKRDGISSDVSAELISTDNERVIRTLSGNRNATISEQSIERVLRIFGHSEDILGTLISRGGLSIGLAERLVSMVSVKLQKQLCDQYGINARLIQQSVNDSREKISLGLIPKDATKTTTTDLVNHMHNSGRLSHSIVLRALCRADLDFFEAGMAALANISKQNACKLIHQGERTGFAALYKATSMPSTMMEATYALLKIILKNERKRSEDIENYSRRIVECIIACGHDKKIPNMRYFIALIGNNNTELIALS